MKKKVIIFQHGGGELANQLWNFVSVYAYCKERGYECRNYSFFEFGKFFNIPVGNLLIDIFFFWPFRSYTKRRDALQVRIWRFLYKLLYVAPIERFLKKNTVSSKNIDKKTYYLPPSAKVPELDNLERKEQTIYMTGWMFRNPVGIKKYREDIVNYFSPNSEISKSTERTFTPLREKFSHTAGVHIRQSDYKVYKSGEFLIPQERIREILDEYLKVNKKSIAETCFVIATDGEIRKEIFEGLNIIINNKSAVEDMFTLSRCDVILGSDSSFGNFAAYYGNVPHIIFKKESIDWNYYSDKSTYFENKYCTLVHY
jgi:hypothetical protein